MYKPLIITIILSYLIMLFILASRQQHILPTILILERLILFIIYYISLRINNQSIIINHSVIIILTMRVSRARIGLRLLVIISRKEGNDSTINTISHIC